MNGIWCPVAFPCSCKEVKIHCLSSEGCMVRFFLFWQRCWLYHNLLMQGSQPVLDTYTRTVHYHGELWYQGGAVCSQYQCQSKYLELFDHNSSAVDEMMSVEDIDCAACKQCRKILVSACSREEVSSGTWLLCFVWPSVFVRHTQISPQTKKSCQSSSSFVHSLRRSLVRFSLFVCAVHKEWVPISWKFGWWSFDEERVICTSSPTFCQF